MYASIYKKDIYSRNIMLISYHILIVLSIAYEIIALIFDNFIMFLVMYLRI